MSTDFVRAFGRAAGTHTKGSHAPTLTPAPGPSTLRHPSTGSATKPRASPLTVPELGEGYRNEFIPARRCFSANKMAVEFLQVLLLRLNERRPCRAKAGRYPC